MSSSLWKCLLLYLESFVGFSALIILQRHRSTPFTFHSSLVLITTSEPQLYKPHLLPQLNLSPTFKDLTLAVLSTFTYSHSVASRSFVRQRLKVINWYRTVDCQALPRQDKQCFVVPASCKVCQMLWAEGWRQMLQHYKEYWGLSRQQLSLSFLWLFGSCVPVLPVFSNNIYSFSNLWWD